MTVAGFLSASAAGSACCNEEQFLLVADYVLYMLACFLLWRSRLLLPLKLFTVFLHEFSHAIGVWLSCGKVQGIEVHADQGGLTHWSAPKDRMKCAKHCVLPAGYIGSAAWGGFLLICSATPATAHAATFVLMAALLVALCYSLFGKAEETEERSRTLPILCVGMFFTLGLLLYISYCTELYYRHLILGQALLLIAVMNTLFATYDIWDDTVRRSVERSDAYKYSEHLGSSCATPRCIGCFWLFLSLVIALFSLGFAVLLSWAQNPAEFSGSVSEFFVASLLVPAAVLVAAALHRRFCSRTYASGGALLP